MTQTLISRSCRETSLSSMSQFDSFSLRIMKLATRAILGEVAHEGAVHEDLVRQRSLEATSLPA